MSVSRVGIVCGFGVVVLGVAAVLAVDAVRPVRGPVFRPVPALDLGPQELGQLAVGRLQLANDGDRELHISGVRASCSCTGIETVNPDGSYSAVTAVTVPPGGVIDAVVRVAVNSPAGVGLQVVVRFETDDPAHPEVALPVQVPLVLLGVRAVPGELALGSVAQNEVVERMVDVVDSAPTPRPVGELRVSNPAVLAAEVVTAPPGEAGGRGGARLVARVRVKVSTTAVGVFDERVSVYTVADRPVSPTSIHVTGRVAPAVEIVPSTVVLPLVSDAGPVYKTSCVCVTADNRPVTLGVRRCPPGYVITLPAAADGPRGRVGVERRPDAPAGPATIELTARLPGSDVSIPVSIAVTQP